MRCKSLGSLFFFLLTIMNADVHREVERSEFVVVSVWTGFLEYLEIRRSDTFRS